MGLRFILGGTNSTTSWSPVTDIDLTSVQIMRYGFTEIMRAIGVSIWKSQGPIGINIMKLPYPFESEKYMIFDVIIIIGIVVLLAIIIPNLLIEHPRWNKIFSTGITIIVGLLIGVWLIRFILYLLKDKK